jgi:hypothetical protein
MGDGSKKEEIIRADQTVPENEQKGQEKTVGLRETQTRFQERSVKTPGAHRNAEKTRTEK